MDVLYCELWKALSFQAGVIVPYRRGVTAQMTVPRQHNDVNGREKKDGPGTSELLGQIDFMLDERARHLYASICSCAFSATLK